MMVVEFIRHGARSHYENNVPPSFFGNVSKGDLTEKGREFLAPSSEEKDFFTLPDLGSEFAQLENDPDLSIEEKELKPLTISVLG